MDNFDHLCARCDQVFQTLKYDEIYEGNTWTGFQQALSEFCYVCVLVWNRIYQPPDGIRRPLDWVALQCPNWEMKYVTTKNIVKKTLIIHCMGFERITFLLIPWQANSNIIRLPLPSIGPRTSSTKSLDQAYQWYTSCRALHTKCVQLQRRSKWLPTRLIDIGSNDTLEWKLQISSANTLLSHEYVTLSYRWGTSQHITLRSTNFESFCCGSPISNLPKTFRDAILVARRLSIRYLWIDSLCILQDSKEDWEYESTRMRDVYANSVCNISAEASADAHGGLFRMRNAVEIRPCRVKAHELGRSQIYYLCEEDLWAHQISSSPLNHRGWVFQERMLAPRLLHFAEKQIFWECFEERKCESFPFGLPNEDPLDKVKDLNLLLEATDSNTTKLPFGARAGIKWRTIIETYSKCSFTKQSDRLIALSGLEFLFKESFDDQYLAGLWKSQLHYLLCWQVLLPGKRSAEYLAPSWSWASLDSPVRFPYDDDSLITILHCKAEYPFGSADPLNNGYITLRGLVIPVTITDAKNDRGKHILLINGLQTHAQIFEDVEGGILTNSSDHYFLVLQGTTTVKGLVLSKSSEAPAAYVRIGSFIMIDESSDLRLIGILSEKRLKLTEDEEVREYFACERWREMIDENKVSTITII